MRKSLETTQVLSWGKDAYCIFLILLAYSYGIMANRAIGIRTIYDATDTEITEAY